MYYESYMAQIFNLFFTFWPVAFYALFDQQYTKEQLISQPSLYSSGLNDEYYNLEVFMKMFINACIQATIMFYMTFVAVDDSITPNHGRAGDMWLDGSISYAAVLIAITAKIMYDQNSHTFLSVTFILLSVGAYFLSFYLYA